MTSCYKLFRGVLRSASSRLARSSASFRETVFYAVQTYGAITTLENVTELPNPESLQSPAGNPSTVCRWKRVSSCLGGVLALTIAVSQPIDAQDSVRDDDSYVGPVATASAQYRGVTTIDTLVKGKVQAEAWTNQQITLFAPTGRVPDSTARRWSEWYRQVDELYQKISNMSDFDQVYRRNDGVNFGPGKKVVGFWESCGAGCGNKTQAEAAPGFLADMLDNPDNPLERGHWIIYYEMARGGRSEPFYGRATWPTNTVLMPHLMAGIAFHHFGGDDALRVGIPGDLLKGLELWEELGYEWTTWFAASDRQQIDGAPSSHGLMAAMLYHVLMETDLDVIARIIDEMTAKPLASTAKQAMCDFQASISSQTGTRFVARMQGPWGLPDDCDGVPIAGDGAPIARADTFAVDLGAPWEVIGNVLANDSGEGLRVRGFHGFVDGSYVALGEDGAVRMSQRGRFDDLAPGTSRTLSVPYQATDSKGAQASAVMRFVVTNNRDNGVTTVQDDSFSVNLGAPWEVIGNVLANDSGEGLRVRGFHGFVDGSYVAVSDDGALRMSQRGMFDDLAPGASRTLTMNIDVLDPNDTVYPSRLDMVVTNRR